MIYLRFISAKIRYPRKKVRIVKLGNETFNQRVVMIQF